MRCLWILFLCLLHCSAMRETYFLISRSPLVFRNRPTTFVCTDLTRQPSRQQLKLRKAFRNLEIQDRGHVLNRSGLKYVWSKKNTKQSLGSFKCGTPGNDVTAVKMRAEGRLMPAAFSQLASVGDDAYITMTPKRSLLANGVVPKIYWWKNNRRLSNFNGRIRPMGRYNATLQISNVTLEDGGVYMGQFRNKADVFAATILVVRECPTDKWSSNCSLPCPLCHNGGRCSADSGECVCLPGFTGANCQSECPPNTFGPTCQVRCSEITGSVTCLGLQVCQRTGCDCVMGWRGSNCDVKRCEPSTNATENIQPHNCKRIQAYDITNKRDHANVTMLEAPSVVEIRARPSFKVNRGQNVTILCSFSGNPLPRDDEIVVMNSNQKFSPTSTTVTSSLKIGEFSLIVTSPDNYRCLAGTEAGEGSSGFNFTLLVPPRAISPPFLIERNPTRLVIGLNSKRFVGDGPIKKLDLMYKREDERDYKIYSSSLDDIIKVEPLSPDTSYNFRVVLHRIGGASGIGPPGPVATLTTSCGEARGGPQVEQLYANTNTSFYITWRHPSFDQARGKVTGYTILYRKLGETTNQSNEIDDRTSTSATVKKLTPMAVYDVKMTLLTCAGHSPFSRTLRVTIGHLDPPTGPEVLLGNCTSRSLFFQWGIPSNSKPHTIIFYEIFFSENAPVTSNVIMLHKNTSQMNYLMDDLMPHTSYKFKVRAFNHEAAGEFSTVLHVTTQEDAPTAPTNVEILVANDHVITLAWDDPTYANGVIRHYDVEVTCDCDEATTIMTAEGNDTMASIKDLKEYTKYQFRVRGFTIKEGAFSEILEARTMSSRPLNNPTIVRVYVMSPQVLNVTWEPPVPSPFDNDVTFYKLIYTDDIRQNDDDWNARVLPSAHTSCQIDRLKPDTVYGFKVAAKTHEFGNFSAEATRRTAKLGLPPPPFDAKMISVRSRNATIGWSIHPGHQITVVKIKYLHDVSKSSAPLVEAAQHNKFTITQLEPATKYEVELVAKNYLGESSSNPRLPFVTNGEVADVRFEETSKFKMTMVALGILLLIIIVMSMVYCRLRAKPTAQPNHYPGSNDTDTLHTNIGMSTIGSTPGISRSGTMISTQSVHSFHSRAASVHSCQFLPENLVIPWEKILFEDVPLGVGNFGHVVKALVEKDHRLIPAAVKMLKEGSTLDDKRDFLAELDTMVRLGHHKNIITLVGACEHNSAMYLCTEFAPHGNLLQFLRRSRRLEDQGGTYTNLSQNQLLNFANDVAHGMAYLSEIQVIHRDLAARNILLGEGHVCKVADFGLSRGDGVYVKRTVSRLPIRWMAIESLNYNVYTNKSDVWSFGILLWEIVSLGGTPYCGMSCAELYEKLPTGYRMEKPINCDDEMYTLMFQCWKDRPYDRPSFSQLCVALERMSDARSSRNYVNTAIFDDFKFANIDVTEEEALRHNLLD
ncbi:tyrosine-protein kinase receptor Tie-1-like [Clavelina lepadiformis]|uniref:tyrosine-protein kinase receptor Tie-1-like n=1 Tax=Clavelina lepadiformis TaxID=159417 RepID=UPI00404106E3